MRLQIVHRVSGTRLRGRSNRRPGGLASTWPKGFPQEFTCATIRHGSRQGREKLRRALTNQLCKRKTDDETGFSEHRNAAGSELARENRDHGDLQGAAGGTSGVAQVKFGRGPSGGPERAWGRVQSGLLLLAGGEGSSRERTGLKTRHYKCKFEERAGQALPLRQGRAAERGKKDGEVNSPLQAAKTRARWTDARLQGIIPFRRYC